MLMAAIMATACSAQPEIPAFARATALPAARAPTPSPTPAPSPLGADLRLLSFGPDQSVAFEIVPTDVSWSISVTGAGPEDLVGIRRVSNPAGDTRYLADLRDEVLLVDDLHPKVLADAGAVGLYVTSSPTEDLASGTWSVDVVSNAGQPHVQVLIRSGETTAMQQLDIVGWVTADIADLGIVEAGWRQQMDAILGPHGMQIGRLDLIVAADAGAPYVRLGVDGLASEVHDACTAASQATGAPPRAALVILSEHIGEGVLTADAFVQAGQGVAYRRPDGTIDGFAVATPGTPVIGPASHGCVAVRAGDNPQERGQIALHEILHQAGLSRHTTEREGRDFDLFDDTPQCPLREFDSDHDLQVNRVECGSEDGDNLMFWAVGGTGLSAEQAWRVRNHPLLHPAG
ncbi:MAG: hypothetical protein ACR2HR_10530 [Euzebya sp.]